MADERFLHDLTEGTIAGTPYWRLGLLGYSTMGERYEWVTIDGSGGYVDPRLLVGDARAVIRALRRVIPLLFARQHR